MSRSVAGFLSSPVVCWPVGSSLSPGQRGTFFQALKAGQGFSYWGTVSGTYNRTFRVNSQPTRLGGVLGGQVALGFMGTSISEHQSVGNMGSIDINQMKSNAQTTIKAKAQVFRPKGVQAEGSITCPSGKTTIKAGRRLNHLPFGKDHHQGSGVQAQVFRPKGVQAQVFSDGAPPSKHPSEHLHHSQYLQLFSFDLATKLLKEVAYPPS